MPEPDERRISVVWSPLYEVDIGPHVFPTRKYRLVRERLLAERELTERDFVEARSASREEVRTVHSEAYVRKIEEGSFTPREIMLLELPFSPALRTASFLCAGGTTATARLAARESVAVHLGGGFHHAFADHGEGFCVLNDVAVAIGALLREGALHRAAVVDLDVHHGNGTAAIFAAEPSVFTFSMHQEWNYPSEKPPSDLDIGLEDGTGDDEYLALLGEHLPALLDRSRPDLVFYLAGADPYREDQLGGLSLTKEGLRERDRTVLQEAALRGVPVAVTLAGGYALRESDTVEIHRNTVLEAVRAREPGRAEGGRRT